MAAAFLLTLGAGPKPMQCNLTQREPFAVAARMYPSRRGQRRETFQLSLLLCLREMPTLIDPSACASSLGVGRLVLKGNAGASTQRIMSTKNASGPSGLSVGPERPWLGSCCVEPNSCLTRPASPALHVPFIFRTYVTL